MKRLKKEDNKKVRNATKVTINGYDFRSKLESFTYKKLIEANINDFGYETHTFILQEGFEYPNESIERGEVKSTKVRPMTYTPDFVYLNGKNEGWIIEIKGFSNETFPLKWKLFKKHLLDKGYNVSLYLPNNQGNVLKCIEMIKNKYNV